MNSQFLLVIFNFNGSSSKIDLKYIILNRWEAGADNKPNGTEHETSLQ